MWNELIYHFMYSTILLYILKYTYSIFFPQLSNISLFALLFVALTGSIKANEKIVKI